MYVKPPRKQFQGGMYVPDNYHGTAFTESENEQPTQEQEAKAQEAEQPSTLSDALPASKKEEGKSLSSLFSGFGGLRSDDILLLALIVLLWRSVGEDEHGTSDITPLLALLLFLG